ncbi:putative anit sigma factor antagonist [Halobacteriovorax marinus SJ]|uniref:Anit sigma factor antagonist n=1 Tax=Halobacteriovorax marinus (strain ATCC BAA-682 / DSM 15412 / SJ) TaxID=862908 RepID=E1X2E2_HALMS|nr:STAS domain-containing protein [Halobacteriovorax marinus]CBW26709.1 putative anit sigma factor antagonist [Halobacteriovorax marinus SJ]
MSLKAQVRTDSLGNITVHMEGGLDYDNSLPFRRELQSLIKDNPLSTVTLDMNGLDFVGSSGIGVFVETLKILNDKKSQIQLSNVKTEFLKVFKLFEYDAMEAMIMDFENDDTEDLNTRYGNRRKTFQN